MEGKPVIVGVAGGTCSGKSTLVADLAKRLGDAWRVKTFMTDHYFRKPGPTVVAPFSGKEYMERNHPDALDQERLFAEFDAAVASGEFDLVFVDGLFTLLLERLRKDMDLKVFVDLPSDERMFRRIKRWMGYGEAMDSIVERYLDTVRHRHAELIEPTRWFADVVVNGTLDAHRGADVVETFVRRLLDERARAAQADGT